MIVVIVGEASSTHKILNSKAFKKFNKHLTCKNLATAVRNNTKTEDTWCVQADNAKYSPYFYPNDSQCNHIQGWLMQGYIYNHKQEGKPFTHQYTSSYKIWKRMPDAMTAGEIAGVQLHFITNLLLHQLALLQKILQSIMYRLLNYTI